MGLSRVICLDSAPHVYSEPLESNVSDQSATQSTPNDRRLFARPVLTAAALVIAIAVGGCGPADRFRQNMVAGSFDGGKLIALNWFTGTNTTSGPIEIDAYADVPIETPGTIDISGPQHWRCAGTFSAALQDSAGGWPFESDQDSMRRKVFSLPKLITGFDGPPGIYRVSIELPSLATSFSHTWGFLGPTAPRGPLQLYENGLKCAQIIDSALLQGSLSDQYLERLQTIMDQARVDGVNHISPSPIRAQLQGLLDDARRAKLSGDAVADPNQRALDYQSAAAILMKMARLAHDSRPAPNPPWELGPADISNIARFATEAANLLSITGLS